jgi:quinone-modifying oxidoreductase subunit QmoC
MADPDIWLCHQCNDCSKKCPRGARPGDVLAAVRKQAVQYHSAPRFLGNLVNRTKYFPLLFMALPAILLALALTVREPLEQLLSLGEPHEALYAAFFPHWLLIGFYASFTGLAFIGAVVGVVRFWQAMRVADAGTDSGPQTLGVVPSMVRTLRSILFHDKFAKCTDQASRRWTHLLAFYGFVALFVVTIWATIDLYLMPVFGVDSLYPFDLLHPMKLLANVGGVVLVVGCVKAITDRRRSQSSVTTAFDNLFVWLLLGVAVTGFLTEVFRFAIEGAGQSGLTFSAYFTYFVHLVLVFGLLVYLPYSKFAHLIYRTVALVYAEHSGRNLDGRQLLPAAGARPQIESHADKAIEAANA